LALWIWLDFGRLRWTATQAKHFRHMRLGCGAATV
jgi:hypothetical protein